MGQFVTSSRKFPVPLAKFQEGLVGYPATSYAWNPSGSMPDPIETTYSYRTSPALSDQTALQSSDLMVTRNGFTTFDPRYDKGHEFWSEKRSIDIVSPEAYYRWWASNGNQMFHRGPIVPTLAGLSVYPSVKGWSSTDTTAMDYGSRAIKATQPLRPNASAGQFIGELFEGLPQMAGKALLKERAHILRGAGSEYLNVQFGWIPFISDLRRMATALRSATRILTQLDRDSGRLVRRRFAFPSSVVTTDPYNIDMLNYGLYQAGFGPARNYVKNPVPTQRVERTETEVWFSGAYSYCIPTDKSLLSRMQEFSTKANVLLGARIDPSVVWELEPWSWLVDWKLGIGNLIANASTYADDGLVIRYGYLMRHVRTSWQYQSQPAVTNAGSEIPISFITITCDRKERIRATPYGFGVSPSAFSDTQWTILGALGMTKGPKSLF